MLAEREKQALMLKDEHFNEKNDAYMKKVCDKIIGRNDVLPYTKQFPLIR